MYERCSAGVTFATGIPQTGSVGVASTARGDADASPPPDAWRSP